MTPLRIEQVLFKDVWRELYPMFVEHYQELKLPGLDDKVFDIDIDGLMNYETNCNMVNVCAMDGDVIVGYMSVIIGTHPFFKDSLFGNTLAFFVVPEYRKNNRTLGYKLLNCMENILRDEYNLDWLDVVVNTNFDLTKWVERAGYTKSDVAFRKSLQTENT